MIEDIGTETQKPSQAKRDGGVNLFTNDSVVLIPTPSPDPKGIDRQTWPSSTLYADSKQILLTFEHDINS